jgi:hypothetical protein
MDHGDTPGFMVEADCSVCHGVSMPVRIGMTDDFFTAAGEG